MKDQYKCPSYYDDADVLRDCKCGKCGEPTMNWIDEIIVEAKQRSVFADHDPYGSRAKWLREKLQEAHTNGTQEALAKVEEWAKEGKDFYEWALPMATTPEQKSHYEENIEMSNELLHHLQQLKDNKTVTLEMNGSSGCGHIEYDTTCPHCHNIRTTTNTKTI